MTFDNFTIKAQEAVRHAVDRASAGGQQAVGSVHLLSGVLEVGENVTRFLLGKAGVPEARLRQVVDSALQAMPRDCT